MRVNWANTDKSIQAHVAPDTGNMPCIVAHRFVFGPESEPLNQPVQINWRILANNVQQVHHTLHDDPWGQDVRIVGMECNVGVAPALGQVEATLPTVTRANLLEVCRRRDSR